MTTHHVIANKTVLPSLRSAREYGETSRPVQLIFSGTPEECHQFLKTRHMLLGSVSCEDIVSVAAGEWTYRIVGDSTSGEPRQNRENVEMELRLLEKSIEEWFNNAVRQHERALLSVQSRRREYRETREKERRGENPFMSSLDHLSSVMNDLSNARTNLREDILVRRAAELVSALRVGNGREGAR